MNAVRWTRAIVVVTTAAVAGCGGGGGYGGGNNNGGGGAPTYTVGGTVTGLKSPLVLRNNGGNDLNVANDGAFAFTTAVANGQPYSVVIQQQPSNPAQNCVVANGAGTIGTSNVTNVAVTCSDLPAADLQQADAGVHSAKLQWAAPAGASSFNVYLSSARNCDVRNINSCPDGKLVSNLTSPGTIGDLRNGTLYFFRIETVYANGARGLSNEIAARPNALAFDDGVRATVVAPDGTVYLGGNFRQVGIATGSAVPLDATIGKPAAVGYPVVDGDVIRIVSDNAGGWYLGGSFTHVNGIARNSVAHVLADGSVAADFDPNINGPVSALAVHGDIVYIGGQFNEAGPEHDDRPCLAAFSRTGELQRWPVEGVPLTCSQIATLAAGSDGTIYAGGFFDISGGGTDRHGLAAFTASGELLATWRPSIDLGFVDALAVSGNTIYVAGVFTTLTSNGETEQRSGLAAIGTDGAIDPDFNPAPDGEVFTLALDGETLYVGGSFQKIGGVDRKRLAALDATGQALLWQADADDSVFGLTVVNHVVYAGGEFTKIGATDRQSLAAIDARGTLLPWHSSPAGAVVALAAADNIVYVGGEFNTIDSVPRQRLAAVDAHGALLPWAPAADFQVRALAIADDTIYAGGDFTEINDSERRGFAAIGLDGQLTNVPAHRFDGPIQALTIAGDTIYVGGIFGRVDNAERRSNVAAINKTGELTGWRPNVVGFVNALASIGSTIYVGGRFDITDAANVTHRNVAAIGSNGVVDPAFHADAALDVWALAHAGDVLYVGGDFGFFGGQLRHGIAAVNAAGVVDSTFAPNVLPVARGSVSVRAIAVDGNRIYFGGTFSAVDNVFRSGLAAVDPSGKPLDWDPGRFGADDVALTLSTGNGAVYAGGFFRNLATAPRFFFGAVTADGTGEPTP